MELNDYPKYINFYNVYHSNMVLRNFFCPGLGFRGGVIRVEVGVKVRG